MKNLIRLWIKPELVVLVRRTPEEVVLENCKGGSEGPTNGAVNCIGPSESCAPCSSTGAS